MKTRKQRLINWIIRFLFVGCITAASILIIIAIEGLK